MRYFKIRLKEKVLCCVLMFWTVFSFNQPLEEHNGIIILSERGCYYLGKKKKKAKRMKGKNIQEVVLVLL